MEKIRSVPVGLQRSRRKRSYSEVVGNVKRDPKPEVTQIGVTPGQAFPF